jgi:hypothetical protein
VTGCIPAEVILGKGLHMGDLRVYVILDRLDVWDRGIVQVSQRRLAQLHESKVSIVGKHLRNLIAAGALEVLYGGSFHAGAVTGDANTYRLIHKQAAPAAPRRAPRYSVGVPTGTPSRSTPRRAISSLTENRRVARGDGSRPACPHPYPCSCADCQGWITAHVAAPTDDHD